MADETKPAAKPAAPMTPTAATAEMASAIAMAMRQTNAYRFGPPAAGPTQRLIDVADLIKSGKGVEAAMAAAHPPYGRKFIDGNAATFPEFLCSQGLLTEAQARKAAGRALTRKPTSLGDEGDE
jgi:hypothetical protein